MTQINILNKNANGIKNESNNTKKKQKDDKSKVNSTNNKITLSLDDFNIKDGVATLNVNGNKLKLDIAGTNPTKVMRRLQKVINNSLFTKHVPTLNKAYNLFDSGKIEDGLKLINDTGLKLSIISKTVNGQVKVQIRIMGVLPFFTTTTDAKYISNFAEKHNLTSNMKTKSDSIAFKPQTFFSPKNATYKFDESSNVRQELKDGTYILLGTGYDVHRSIKKSILNVVDKLPDNYTKAELTGMNDFSKLIDNKNITKDKLKIAYQNLLDSSINRRNEIQKNFGELYVGLHLSLNYPNSKILLPSTGNASFSDLILVHQNGDDTNIIVEEVSIKSGKGVSSSMASIFSSIPYKSNEYNKNIQLLSKYSIRGYLKSLKDEDNINTQKVRKIALDIYKRHSNKFDQVLNTALTDDKFNNFLFKETTPKSFNELSTQQILKLFYRYKPAAEILIDNEILPNVDCMSIKNRIKVVQIYEDGNIDIHSLSCNTLAVRHAKEPFGIITIALAT